MAEPLVKLLFAEKHTVSLWLSVLFTGVGLIFAGLLIALIITRRRRKK